MMKTIGFMFTVFVLFSSAAFSQSTRSLVNGGVDKYKNKKYVDSEIDFRKGLEKAPDNFAANFNLGDSYYRQQKFDDAINSFKSALPLASSNHEKAKVYHNIGNSYLKSQKYQESVNAYKKALKLNPDDEDTKYNLSYALNMLNQKQNQKNNQNQNNKNNQDNKNNQNNQNQQNQDNQNKDKNKQDQNKNNQNQQNNQDNKNQQNKQDQKDQQPPKNEESKQDNLKQKQEKMSKEEAERILQALKNNEKDLQKKLRKQKGVPVKTDKDW